MARFFYRLLLTPNLLGLDAPLLAVAWLYVFAKTWRIDYHPWQAYVALGLLVFAVRICARLLEESVNRTDPHAHRKPGLGLLHRYRGSFHAAGWLAFLGASVLIVTEVPMAIFSYLGYTLALLAGFLTLTLFQPRTSDGIPYARNILAGLALAYGVAMVAHVYQPSSGPLDLPRSREVMLFSFLCIIGICAVDLWEHAAASEDPSVKEIDEMSITAPVFLLGLGAIGFALLEPQSPSRPFYYSILSGAAFLQLVNRNRHRLPHAAIPTLASAALGLPVLVFIALRQP